MISKPASTLFLSIVFLFIFSACQDKKDSRAIAIYATGNTDLASQELSDHLQKIYGNYDFAPANPANAAGQIILSVDENISAQKDFYKLRASASSDTLLQITGNSSRAVLYGVYDFLTSQGFQFLLSETLQPAASQTLAFPDTTFTNFALANRRIVFNWHNFLSGCTGWDFEHYKQWIDQSRRMKYNTIMLHFYGNNPLFQFDYNDNTKPVGYIANSLRGRDWGVAHVNDVQRMPGGDVFKDHIYGAKSSKVPDDQHPEASREVLQKVFQYAEQKGMDICLAYDFDTDASNPQNIINTLPDSAKFEVNGRFCVRPDTEAGYAYYKKQMQTFKELYPEMDMFTVWFRRNAGLQALWREITKENLPADWKAEFEQIENTLPQVKKYDGTHASDFAIAKVAVAIEQICKEIDFKVEVSVGSWDYKFIPSCDKIYPAHIPFIALDYYVNYTDTATYEYFDTLKEGRKIIPIVWAHHDDFTYMGRPYVPFADFAKTNQDRHIESFGIIHWTTRPLDLYFKNTSKQVWNASQNENYKTTCEAYANQIMPGNAAFADYVYKWHTEGPQFGRETLDYFMHHWVKINPEMATNCTERLKILESIKTDSLSQEAKNVHTYFTKLEQFSRLFIENQILLDSAHARLKRGDLPAARQTVQELNPEAAVQLYKEAITARQFSRGEEGLLLSLDLRWLPDFMSIRQQLGMEPVRVNFEPTNHETMAQASGKYTFFIDDQKQWWLSAGQKETGYEATAGATPQTSFVEIDSVFSFPLTTIRRKNLLPGKYKLTLLYSEGAKPTVYLKINGQKDKKATCIVAENEVTFFVENEEGITLEMAPATNKSFRLYGFEMIAEEVKPSNLEKKRS